MMGFHDRHIHNKEILEATWKLETQTIPIFAKNFENQLIIFF